MNSPEQDRENITLFTQTIQKMQNFGSSRIRGRDTCCRLTDKEVNSILANIGVLLSMIQGSKAQFDVVLNLLSQLKEWEGSPKDRLTLPKTLRYAIDQIEKATGDSEPVADESVDAVPN